MMIRLLHLRSEALHGVMVESKDITPGSEGFEVKLLRVKFRDWLYLCASR